MSRVLFALSTTLVFLPLQALAQPDMEHGFPISDSPSGDLPCHMVTSGGNTLDLAKLCGGAPQASRAITPQTQSGLVISNITFRNPSSFSRLGGKALLINGTLINKSNQPITARTVNYSISAISNGQREIVVNNSETLSSDFESVTLNPGQSIQFTHSLDRSQMTSMSRYIMQPDIFTFQVKNTSMEVADKLPVVDTGSALGQCNDPDDLDSAGRRCGRRASGVRRGGR